MTVQFKLHGTVQQVFIGDHPETFVTTPVEQATVEFTGFAGDRHSGWTRKADSRTPHYRRGVLIRNDRQLSILSVEELAAAAERMGLPELRGEWLGANLTLTGIARLTQLPPTTRLFFGGGVVLVITAENLPCRQAGGAVAAATGMPDAAERFPLLARGLRGVVACVEMPGVIRSGEPVEARIPKIETYRPI